MKWINCWLAGFSFLLTFDAAFAFSLEPAVLNSGQGIVMNCDASRDDNCNQLCHQAYQCIFQESYCRSCAGTQNLRLKRILDETGISLMASDSTNNVGSSEVSKEMGELFTSGMFVSLHPKTIYNFFGSFNSPQLITQFQQLCGNESAVPGILILKLDPKTHALGKIAGAFCENPDTGDFELRRVNTRSLKFF